MSSTIGEKLKITLFGQSHSQAIGVVIDGLPSGIEIDKQQIREFMQRRAPGGEFATKRKEADEVEFLSGLNENGFTCGAPICAIIKNTDVKSSDYENLKLLPRPSHSDYSAFLRYGEFRDVRGGGQFSGRLTAPMCIAGAICKSLLEAKGIKISAHLSSVGKIEDKRYNMANDEIENNLSDFPVIDLDCANKMKEAINLARENLDSIGATIECKVVGVPGGVGEPPFDGMENVLARYMFSIPAVKGFEMGLGFESSSLLGSENNDAFTVVDNKIVTKTNNSGGVNGGITNGMPLIFRVGFKPTPSIAKPQQSVNLKTLTEEQLEIKGRHDPCVAVRAVPIVEAYTAVALADLLLEGE